MDNINNEDFENTYDGSDSEYIDLEELMEFSNSMEVIDTDDLTSIASIDEQDENQQTDKQQQELDRPNLKINFNAPFVSTKKTHQPSGELYDLSALDDIDDDVLGLNDDFNLDFDETENYDSNELDYSADLDLVQAQYIDMSETEEGYQYADDNIDILPDSEFATEDVIQAVDAISEYMSISDNASPIVSFSNDSEIEQYDILNEDANDGLSTDMYGISFDSIVEKDNEPNEPSEQTIFESSDETEVSEILDTEDNDTELDTGMYGISFDFEVSEPNELSEDADSDEYEEYEDYEDILKSLPDDFDIDESQPSEIYGISFESLLETENFDDAEDSIKPEETNADSSSQETQTRRNNKVVGFMPENGFGFDNEMFVNSEPEDDEILDNIRDDEYDIYEDITVADVIAQAKQYNNSGNEEDIDEIDLIALEAKEKQEEDLPEIDNFGDNEIFRDLSNRFSNKKTGSEIAYAFRTDSSPVPNFIPPLTSNSIDISTFDCTPDTLGICIVGRDEYGTFINSQKEIQADDLFDDNLFSANQQWSSDVLKEIPIKALFACSNYNVTHAIAVSPSCLPNGGEACIEALIDNGSVLLINTSDYIAMSIEPYFDTITELNSAITTSEDFEEQARIKSLQSIFTDNELNPTLVSDAISIAVEGFFSQQCCELIKKVANADNRDARDLLLGNSITIKREIENVVSTVEDDNYKMARELVTAASILLEDDRLSHSLHTDSKNAERIAKLLKMKGFNDTFKLLASGVSAQEALDSIQNQ